MIMIMLVESGSTKSDWLLVQDNGLRVNLFQTMGFNPHFHSSDFMEQEIRRHTGIMEISGQLNAVKYYGAGCSNDYYKGIIQHALSSVFPSASINVDHDLMAAIYASYTGVPCLSCILGTGSNIAYFDGKVVQKGNAGLGYILGDEGSGSYFGKKLLTAYLYKKLPETLMKELELDYNLDRSGILKNVYEKPFANVFLASFAPFISKHQDLPFLKAMLYEGFDEFIQIHVCSFENYRQIPTHFVGSIAYYFKSILEQAANNLHVQVGQIIQSPIQKLADYHIKNTFPHS